MTSGRSSSHAARGREASQDAQDEHEDRVSIAGELSIQQY